MQTTGRLYMQPPIKRSRSPQGFRMIQLEKFGEFRDKIFDMHFGRSVSTVHAADLSDRLKNGKRPIVIDIRQPDAYRTGHIASAKLIPPNKLSNPK